MHREKHIGFGTKFSVLGVLHSIPRREGGLAVLCRTEYLRETAGKFSPLNFLFLSLKFLSQCMYRGQGRRDPVDHRSKQSFHPTGNPRLGRGALECNHIVSILQLVAFTDAQTMDRKDYVTEFIEKVHV